MVNCDLEATPPMVSEIMGLMLVQLLISRKDAITRFFLLKPGVSCYIPKRSHDYADRRHTKVEATPPMVSEIMGLMLVQLLICFKDAITRHMYVWRTRGDHKLGVLSALVSHHSQNYITHTATKNTHQSEHWSSSRATKRGRQS